MTKQQQKTNETNKEIEEKKIDLIFLWLNLDGANIMGEKNFENKMKKRKKNNLNL